MTTDAVTICPVCKSRHPLGVSKCHQCGSFTETLTGDFIPKESSVDATLAERGKRYGKFTGHAQVAQRLKDVIYYALASEGRARLADDQKEALDMICHKMARIVNGDPNYADSWHDIAGYAKLVEDRLNGVSK